MSKPEDLLSAARKLAPAEQIDLVEHLLDELDKPDEAVDALWLREAQDRLAAYRRGEMSAVPLAEVLGKHTSR